MKTFAEILKEKRKEAKLSRRKLAEMCDITADSIRYWENERTTPTMFGLIALANAFNCSLDELVGRNILKANETLIKFPRVVQRKIPIYDERSIDFDKSTTVWDLEEMKPQGIVVTRFLFESSAMERLKELQNEQSNE